MNLTAYRGQPFQEVFTFKNSAGQVIRPPAGVYAVTLQNGTFVQTFNNLSVNMQGVVWNMTAAQVDALPYSTLYFTLTNNGAEVTRGVLSVR